MAFDLFGDDDEGMEDGDGTAASSASSKGVLQTLSSPPLHLNITSVSRARVLSLSLSLPPPPPTPKAIVGRQLSAARPHHRPARGVPALDTNSIPGRGCCRMLRRVDRPPIGQGRRGEGTVCKTSMRIPRARHEWVLPGL